MNHVFINCDIVWLYIGLSDKRLGGEPLSLYGLAVKVIGYGGSIWVRLDVFKTATRASVMLITDFEFRHLILGI